MAPRILITGSRNYSDPSTLRAALFQSWRALGQRYDTVLVSGAHRHGADALAEQYWRELCLPVETHPADWSTHGRAAGPIRNQQMVDRGADICLAFPTSSSIGTWDCVRRAKAAGIPVEIHKQ